MTRCTSSARPTAAAATAWPLSWIGRALALGVRQHAPAAARAVQDALDGLLEDVGLDRRAALADGEQRGLVDDVGQVGAGEAGRAPRDAVEVDGGRQRLGARVQLEDPQPALVVGLVDGDVAVEAAGAQDRRVEDVGAVRRADDDEAARRRRSRRSRRASG